MWLGTYDPSAYLTVPAAIAWQREYFTDDVRQRACALARLAVEHASRVDGIERLHPDAFFRQMGLIDVTSRHSDAEALQSQLFASYRIEVPAVRWKDRTLLRVSAHAYTTEQHIQTLVRALEELG